LSLLFARLVQDFAGYVHRLGPQPQRDLHFGLITYRRNNALFVAPGGRYAELKSSPWFSVASTGKQVTLRSPSPADFFNLLQSSHSLPDCNFR
jgi:hypothetical protein